MLPLAILALFALVAFGFYQNIAGETRFQHTVDLIRDEVRREHQPAWPKSRDANMRSSQLGSTLLIYFARTGEKDAIDYLLAAGADPTREDRMNHTARDWADLQGHPGIARALKAAENAWRKRGS